MVKKKKEQFFNRKLRYINRNGHKIGQGVWYDEDGHMLKPGEAVYDRDNQRVIQCNTDGTKTFYTREQWHKKKTKDHETRVLQNDRRWGIPYLPEKKMSLTINNGGKYSNFRGASFSENVLDSIAVNAERADIPFSTGLAIAAKESTIGNGWRRKVGNSPLPWMRVLNKDNDSYNQNAKAISYEGNYSPTALISNWKQRAENPYYAYEYTDKGYLRTTRQPESYYEEDFRPTVNKDTDYTFDNKSPLQHGFEKYKEDPYDYNPGDKQYPKKVENVRKELVNYSPEIQAYMQKHNLKAYGGPLKDWDTLSLEEKAEMMKVAINNGITTLPEIKKAYNKFAEGGPKDTWTMQDEAGYRAWRESLPKNLRDTKDRDYDMRAAYKAGVKPRWNEYDKKYHLQSRVPESGRILKAPHHPTYLEALAEDASLGYYPTIDSKGNTYTETWEGNTLYPREIEVPYKAYGGNLFGNGGKKTSAPSNSSIAMDYLRSKGMNEIAASAIVGTLQAESGLNPAIHAKMKGDSGEGLAQWTGSRKNQFWSTLEKIEPGAKKRYGSIVNVPLERQLDVVMAEKPDVTFAINNAKDLHTATDIMLRGYENGGGNINNLASIGQINNIYGKWNNGYDRQFNTRLGYAKNLFGTDATPYTISQNALDNINADINNVDLSGLSSNGIPMLGVPTMENQAPYTTSTQPTMAWEKEEKPTAITEFEYTPEQERRDNLRSMSNVFNLMGIENPFMDTFRQVDGYSNNPLMAMANMNI